MLYDKSLERDNCGFGLIAHIEGEPSHKVVRTAIHALARMHASLRTLRFAPFHGVTIAHADDELHHDRALPISRKLPSIIVPPIDPAQKL